MTGATGPTSGPGAGGSGAAGGSGPGAGGNGTGGATGGTGGTGGAGAPQNQFLYVANQDDDTVSVYAIDDAGGLIYVEDEAVAGRPGPLTVTPAQTRLYAASVTGQTVSAFDIDPATGELTALGGPVGVSVRPVYITVDSTTSYLLLTSYGDNRIQSYGLMGDGTLAAAPITDRPGPGLNPHAIVLSPSNDFAFVPNTNPTPETISQLVFDASTGALSDNPTGATLDVSGAVAIGPRHATFHPTLDVFYVVNEHADTVTRYDYNPTTGALTEGPATSTLPGGVASDTNFSADVHVTANGAALYASNRGDDSIAMFSLDAAGALTVIGHIATETVPREFEISRDGRFVYVAGQDSDTLAAYAVQPDGTLTPLNPPTYAVGGQPMWVLAISVDQP